MKDRYFRFARSIVRWYMKPYTISDCSAGEADGSAGAAGTSPAATGFGPAVYVVHHQNLRGPITGMAWFDRPMRPWVLSVFCSRKACFDQYYHYTFTQRFRYSKFVAALIAFPLSLLLPPLMRSMRAIPVYRDPRETIKTFRQSLSTLQAGESLLISPDIDYADSSETIGELYDGFLALEKYYRRETGSHIPFVPLYIDVQNRRILVGPAVRFGDALAFKDAKNEASRRIRSIMQRLKQSCETESVGVSQSA